MDWKPGILRDLLEKSQPNLTHRPKAAVPHVARRSPSSTPNSGAEVPTLGLSEGVGTDEEALRGRARSIGRDHFSANDGRTSDGRDFDQTAQPGSHNVGELNVGEAYAVGESERKEEDVRDSKVLASRREERFYAWYCSNKAIVAGVISVSNLGVSFEPDAVGVLVRREGRGQFQAVIPISEILEVAAILLPRTQAVESLFGPGLPTSASLAGGAPPDTATAGAIDGSRDIEPNEPAMGLVQILLASDPRTPTYQKPKGSPQKRKDSPQKLPSASKLQGKQQRSEERKDVYQRSASVNPKQVTDMGHEPAPQTRQLKSMVEEGSRDREKLPVKVRRSSDARRPSVLERTSGAAKERKALDQPDADREPEAERDGYIDRRHQASKIVHLHSETSRFAHPHLHTLTHPFSHHAHITLSNRIKPRSEEILPAAHPTLSSSAPVGHANSLQHLSQFLATDPKSHDTKIKAIAIACAIDTEKTRKPQAPPHPPPHPLPPPPPQDLTHASTQVQPKAQAQVQDQDEETSDIETSAALMEQKKKRKEFVIFRMADCQSAKRVTRMLLELTETQPGRKSRTESRSVSPTHGLVYVPHFSDRALDLLMTLCNMDGMPPPLVQRRHSAPAIDAIEDARLNSAPLHGGLLSDAELSRHKLAGTFSGSLTGTFATPGSLSAKQTAAWLLRSPTPTLLLPESVSSLLSPAMAVQISQKLPPTVALRAWGLLFDTALHGVSMRSFFAKTEGAAPALIVILDHLNCIFGGYSPEGFKLTRHYYGTGETFVFSFRPITSAAATRQAADVVGQYPLDTTAVACADMSATTLPLTSMLSSPAASYPSSTSKDRPVKSEGAADSRPRASANARTENRTEARTEGVAYDALAQNFDCHVWSGINNYFVYSDFERLTFGGGGQYALAIYHDLLRGSSAPCPTFASSSLSVVEDFSIQRIQVYGFDRAF